MELRQYVAKVDLAKQTELGKVKLIAYSDSPTGNWWNI